jgi:hypothetical protein
MAYVIQTRYKADAGELHAQSRAAHLEYLSNNLDRLLAAGGLIDDDGTGGQGGVIILDTDDRDEAEDFIANDPFNKAGLFESVSVTRWRKAFFNFERLV